jgi:hypothetical protein
MIIENIHDCALTKDLKVLANLYQNTKGKLNPETWKHVENNLSSDRILFLHSGSWRFQRNALYIEYDYLKDYPIDWHPNTKFSNHGDQFLTGLVSTLKISDVLLFHPVDVRYKTPIQIQDFCNKLKKKFPFNTSLHLVTSMTNICINRLRYSRNMIENEFDVKLIENDIIWIR